MKEKELSKSRYICITLYDVDGNKDEITDKTKEIFKSFFTKTGAEYLYGAIETCPSTGRKHIQGYIRYKNAVRNYRPLQHIYKEGHYKLSKANDLASNLFYCAKEQEDTTHLIELGNRPDQGRRTDLESAKDDLNEHGIDRVITDHPVVYIKYHKGFNAYNRELQRIKHAPKPKDNIIWRDWQRDLLGIIEGQPDPRKIHFRVDLLGNTGKSFFAREMLTRGMAYLVTGGKHDRMQHGYAYQPIIIFDIPRATFDESTGSDGIPYAVIENFKNGIANRMYGEPPAIFSTPHVVVFSNYLPNMNKLSQDRYDIQEIN